MGFFVYVLHKWGFYMGFVVYFLHTKWNETILQNFIIS